MHSPPSLQIQTAALVKMSNLALTGLRRRSENDDQPSSRVVQIWRTGAPHPLLYPQPAEEDRPWRLFEERIRTGPYELSRFPLQPYSPMRILIVGRGDEDMMNPRLRQFISNSPPRVRNHWQISMPPVPEDSGLPDEEFNKAMKKLKKQEYTPPYPRRRRPRKRGLFSNWTSSAAKDRDGDDVDVGMDQEEEGKECTICLEAFVLNENVLMTPCNHMFHRDCLVPWLKSHGQCPVCRHVIVERRPEPAIPQSTGINGTNHHRYNNEETSDAVSPRDLVSLMRAMEEAFNWVNSSSHTSSYP